MKPDWKDAPEWAQYRAMDEDGALYWHERQPTWDAGHGEWHSSGRITLCCVIAGLEQRP